MPGWWVENLSTPAPAGITITGGTPSVTATNHKTITPTSATIHATGGQPAAAGIVATPTGATLTATGGAPTVKQDTRLTPSGATVTATGGAPSVVKNTRLTPTGATIATTGSAPTITNSSPVSYDAVAGGGGTFGSNFSYNHTAAVGADVFVMVNWDRSGASVTGVTYGGAAMTQVGSTVLHNNTAAAGGFSLYRIAAAGDGTAKSVAVSRSGGAWFLSNAISFKSVSTVGSATSAFGSSASASQSLTVASGITLQAVSSANGGTGVGDYTTFSGCTNRYHFASTGGTIVLNTVTATGTASSTSPGAQPWAAISVPLT